MFQHNPPFWKPPEKVKTPILWIAAEKDGAIGLRASRRSAEYFRAEFVQIQNAGHNLMLELNEAEIIHTIHEWLVGQKHIVKEISSG